MTAPPRTARVLVVANRTASTPQLLDEVARRRDEARFTLLIPPEHGHHDADWTPDEAGGMLRDAARTDVGSLDAGTDPLDTIHEAVGDGEFDEIILCVPEEHLSRLRHHDLTRRVQRLGLPVLVIPPEGTTLPAYLKSGLPGVYRTLE